MTVDGDLEAALGTPGGCKYGVIYEGLSEKGQALVDRRMPDGRYAIGAEKVSDILAKNELYAGATAVKRHRAGRCGCPPRTT